jgi:hypothetical protein
MQRTVDRPRAEGRLSSLEDFLRVVGKVRDRNHGLFLVPPRPPDATVENHGSIYLVRPHTTDAEQWIEDNVLDDAQWFGSALIVEHRYIEALVAGMRPMGWWYAN